MKLIKEVKTLSCGVLVIGGGGAGLRSAIAARSSNADVLLVSKTGIGHATNTYISKALIAATGWGDSDDDENAHVTDTIKGGRFLSDRQMVSRMAEKVRSEIAFLRDSGVQFAMKGGSPRVLKTPGHSYPRHVHGANWVGSDFIRPLKSLAKQVGVRFVERVFVSRLLADEGRITGATCFSRDGTFLIIRANAVVLATGGYAQIFVNTDNAYGITGDGQAQAYDLGVPLKDMEFVQFYPTATGRRGNRLFLYEGILAQEGVSLRDSKGVDIMEKHGVSDIMSLTRDRLTQLIMQEIEEDPSESQHVVMDLEALSDDKAEQLERLLPPAWSKGQKTFDVTPTAHFCMGGVVTNENGETCVDGFFAVGEVTAGIHGANRLAGNALAEVFSMGSWVGEKAARRAKETEPSTVSKEVTETEKGRLESLFSEKGLRVGQLTGQLKELMWHKVGIIRHESGLNAALLRLQGPWRQAVVECPADLVRFLEFQNMRLIATMVCRSALERTESRGAHFRADYPAEDNDHWLKNLLVRKKGAVIDLEATPVEPRSTVATRGPVGNTETGFSDASD